MAKKVEKKVAKKVTTRRKRVAKKVPTIKPVGKILNDSELRTIEVSVLETQNAKLIMGNEEQVLRNYLLEFELLKVKIEKQKTVVADRDVRYKNKSQSYDTTMKGICEKYDVNKSKFGYNPDTGEIIE